MSQIIIAVVIMVVIAVFSSWNLVVKHRKEDHENKIGSAGVKSREIVEETLKTVETKKRETMLEAKEEALRTRNELERETRERRAELQHYEDRVLSKEENLDKKRTLFEEREQTPQQREESIVTRSRGVDSLYGRGMEELERITGLLVEQTKKFLLRSVEDDVKHDKARPVRDLENSAKEEVDKRVKKYVVSAIQRCAADSVAEFTVPVVQLPGDEMKGRIINRKDRNIRTLEQLTGMELIVDSTPEAIVLPGFDPVCRETAKVTFGKLINDSHIHPMRIEEMVGKVQRETDTQMREAGEAVVFKVGVHNIHPKLIELLGHIRYRMSYGQNALRHSIGVTELSDISVVEVGIDVCMAKRTDLLHDIGKVIDHEIEGPHVQLDAELCRKYKKNQIVINTAESHHGDVEPESLIVCIVQAAGTIPAARPGAGRGTIEIYTNCLVQFEEVTNSFEGVKKSSAIQADREAHTVVVPEKVTDSDIVILTHNVVKRIEQEMQYPGQIRVNVTRKSWIQDAAK